MIAHIQNSERAQIVLVVVGIVLAVAMLLLFLVAELAPLNVLAFAGPALVIGLALSRLRYLRARRADD